MENHSSYTGSCLCGSIQYAVDAFSGNMTHCHCSMCRKFHGAAFASYGAVKLEDFHWLKGEEALKEYVAENGTRRMFCGNCGASLIFVSFNDEDRFVELALGTLDSEIDMEPDAHIFTRYSASWVRITDGLPEYPEDRNS